MTKSTLIRWTRVAIDDARETLTLVRLDSGETHYCAELDRETPYLVQVTAGPGPGDDLVGIYDLDGERVELPSPGSWDAVTDAPADVIAAVGDGWATGTTTVERMQ